LYTALSATSETLAEYLRQQLAADIDFFANGTMEVTLNNPHEMTDGGRQGLSVWLYRVERDEQRVNQPPRRIGPSRIEPTPLPLRLHYLITPIVNLENAESPSTEQTILGRVLQALHDRPVLRGADLQGDLAGTQAELTARLEALGLEEIARVWEALERSYQLSVSYEVGVVYIQSQREPEAVSPVEVVRPEWGVITATEPA
jgi:hypothetical protein